MKFSLRDYTPPPLAYPYKPMRGPIPAVVQDRLAFAAFKARTAGDDLGVFMVRAWQEFRFPHLKMLHALLDHGHVRRVIDPVFGDSWAWIFAMVEERPERSEDAPQTEQKLGFFDVDPNQPFTSSVEVAPKISPMGWTHP